MTLKDGKIFGSGTMMTTTDSLQLQWRYCKDRPSFEYKGNLTGDSFFN